MTAGSSRPSVTEIFEQHASYVWANLHRMGVRSADLPDLLQEVFVVVHRRLDSYDPAVRVTTWLYGICLRVAAAHRRRAHVRREEIVAAPPEPGRVLRTPEDDAVARDEAERLRGWLADLDAAKRAVFVMYEIEEWSCAEIAEHLGVPLGTVHSRLHHARRALRRRAAREGRQRRSGAA